MSARRSLVRVTGNKGAPTVQDMLAETTHLWYPVTAAIAQLVEHHPGTMKVPSSTLGCSSAGL